MGGDDGGSFVPEVYTTAYKLRGKQVSGVILGVGTCPFQMLLPQRGPGGRDGSHPKPGSQQGPTFKSQEECA